MSKLLYFLAVFAESGLSVLGIRATYEQPPYTIERTIADGIEVRSYSKRVAVETPIGPGGEAEAFGRLFRYITGANQGHTLVAMTAPVAQSAKPIAETRPLAVQPGPRGSLPVMRFFLPAAVAHAGAPVPTEAGVAIIALPPVRLGVVRFSGTMDQGSVARQTGRLRHALSEAGIATTGEAILFTYDPPFTIPPLRRNEVALTITD